MMFRIMNLEGNYIHLKARSVEEAILIAMEEGLGKFLFIDDLQKQKSYVWDRGSVVELLEVEEVEYEFDKYANSNLF